MNTTRNMNSTDLYIFCYLLLLGNTFLNISCVLITSNATVNHVICIKNFRSPSFREVTIYLN
jgi:hypothetical protein